jgi:hypothetical protein
VERRTGRAPGAYQALAAYTAIALVATWPLARGLGRDVAWDLGDSLLNMWILAWDCEQLLAMLRGDLSRAAAFFDANIFHPAPLTLAYSEHLLPQALQVLPIYAITKNPILCYNLLFLSTIVLSALGTFLLVRELTGNAVAAFVAGLLFAFAPYRLAQSTHLQVLSAQWMPFALYAMRRYFETGRVTRLLAAAVAVAVQGLSCGYYLLYFPPFAAAYAVWEAARQGTWRRGRTWLHLAAAGAIAAALVAPVLLPYAEVRERFGMVRPRTEVTRLSADVYSYGTAWTDQPLWGGVINAFPKPEGELFPGFVAVGLAVIGVTFRRGSDRTRPTNDVGRVVSDPPRWRRILVYLLAATAAIHTLLAVVTLLERRVVFAVGPIAIQASDVTQLVLRTLVAFILILALSPAARARTAALMRDRGFFLVALVAAAWLSLGPEPRTLGRPLDLAAPYGVLYEHVPGVDGLRVPARFGMVVALMLAVLGGYGFAAFGRGRRGVAVAAVVAAAFLLEGTNVPFLVNGAGAVTAYNTPDARVYPPARAPRIYVDGVARLEGGVLAELPLGQLDYDLRAVYYTTAHWRPIINGYSGFFPLHYGALQRALAEVPRHADLSLSALRAAGATHVLVHEGAYLGNEGGETSAALRSLGAVDVHRDGTDVLLALPR